jgi:NAD(P)-dependent dehydrogenase (short-subunit alcohol dehydrogenase family)
MSLEAMTLDGIVTSSVVGRVAIITGAGQGIGRAFATAFARAGAIPVIADKNAVREIPWRMKCMPPAGARLRSRPTSQFLLP